MKDIILYKVNSNYYLSKTKADKIALSWKHTLRGYVSDKEIIDSYVNAVRLSDIIIDFK